MSTRHLVTNDQASGSEPGKQKGPWPETLFSISRWTIHLTNKKSCQWCRYTSIISSRETTCKWVAKQEMAELFAAALGPVSQKFTERWRLCAEGLLGSVLWDNSWMRVGEAGVGRQIIWTEMRVQVKPWQSHSWGFPGGSVGKNPLPIQEMWVWSLGQEDPLENRHPLQYPCLGNPMNRGAWWATVHGVAKEDLATKQVPQLTLELGWSLSYVPSWAEEAESLHPASSSSQPVLYRTENSPQRDSTMSSQQPMLPAAGGRGK